MTVHAVVLGLSALAVLALHDCQGRGVSPASDASRAADLAAIEKARQQDIDATFSRDPAALTDYWTEDAIRIGVGQPVDVDKQAIRASNERLTSNKAFKVLSYVPEIKDFAFLDGGWAVEWRSYSGSYVDSPGGEAKHVRGTVLMVWKKLPPSSCASGAGSITSKSSIVSSE